MKTIYLMEPNSGTVRPEDDWKDEMSGWTFPDDDGNEISSPENQQEQFDSLIEVKKDNDGHWMEVPFEETLERQKKQKPNGGKI